MVTWFCCCSAIIRLTWCAQVFLNSNARYKKKTPLFQLPSSAKGFLGVIASVSIGDSGPQLSQLKSKLILKAFILSYLPEPAQKME